MKHLNFSATLFFLFISLSLSANHLGGSLILSAKMTGASEVPAVNSNGLGVASFVLNSTFDTMCININVTGLSGPITGIHVHEGAIDTTGPVVKDLVPFVSGTHVAATLTGADLTPAKLYKYLSGQYYVNVHTTLNPSGEIRGQIELETDHSYQAYLTGAQQVPPIPGTGVGVAVFNLSKDLTVMDFHVTVDSLTGPMASAHLHYGLTGTNGPVAIDLTPDIVGNTINGTIANPPAALIDSLKAGRVYINTHTSAFPNGEIRGQIWNMKNRLYFDGKLNGAQEVPAVVTTAVGSAALQLNISMDTLWVQVASTGLSGPITGAHIHQGAAGVSGPVLIDLVPYINGNAINATITGAALTPAVVNMMLKGETYINIHTNASPGGEIRAQVYRLAREGYTFQMEGAQQVPPVSTPASGGGIVTIDRDQTNAHIMLTSSGMTSTGIHFHQGIAGVNGPVFFDLAPYFVNDGIFTYWTAANATPFNTAMSLKFRNDSVYVNNHSVAFGNGEIRGQVERGFTCYAITTGIHDLSFAEGDGSLYPNPFRNILTLELNSKLETGARVELLDIAGNRVFEQNNTLKTGFNRIELNTGDLPKGLYLVRISANGQQLAHKVIKE